jgi:phospholipase/carboxylesterase
VAALARVDQSMAQAAARFHIAPGRVFIAGFDCGGTMALRLALAAPELFAGVASMGGSFPQGHQPLLNLQAARRLPMLIAHGRDSETYPIQRVCEELRLFHVAGMSLNLRQYPCGHELTTQMLSDLDVWMMEIVTGAAATSSARPTLPTDELN